MSRAPVLGRWAINQGRGGQGVQEREDGGAAVGAFAAGNVTEDGDHVAASGEEGCPGAAAEVGVAVGQALDEGRARWLVTAMAEALHQREPARPLRGRARPRRQAAKGSMRATPRNRPTADAPPQGHLYRAARTREAFARAALSPGQTPPRTPRPGPCPRARRAQLRGLPPPRARPHRTRRPGTKKAALSEEGGLLASR